MKKTYALSLGPRSTSPKPLHLKSGSRNDARFLGQSNHVVRKISQSEADLKITLWKPA